MHGPQSINPNFAIRSLRDSDRQAWEPLWAGYLEFYDAILAQSVTDTTWRRLMDPAEPMWALGACKNDVETGELMGIVHFVLHPSTWTVGPYCYLQDLFTAADALCS
jgi:hypothetical protein